MPHDSEVELHSKPVEQPSPTFSADGGEQDTQTSFIPPATITTSVETIANHYKSSQTVEANIAKERSTQPLHLGNKAQIEPTALANQNTSQLPAIIPAIAEEQAQQWQPAPTVAPNPNQYQTPNYNPALPSQQWQAYRQPMDAARYRYLTTPPPIVRQPKVKPRDAASMGGWWGGPIASGSDMSGRILLALAGVVVLGIVLFLIFNRSSDVVTPSGVAGASVGAVTVTDLPATSDITAQSTPDVELVGDNEKWGMVLVNNAIVRAVPLEAGNINQKLKQDTLLAFEKKSSAGWYMLAGGGWIKREDVRVFTSKEAALTAITQAQQTATAAASANPLLNVTPTVPADSSSPADLSAKGALTFQTLNCNIKGEIAATQGLKTYYMPNQADYNGLTMLPVENHRWFCSEQDATKNGFVKSSSPVLPTSAPSPTFGVTQNYPTPSTTRFYGYYNTPVPTITPSLATPTPKH